MTPELINALSNAPAMLVLIYLLVRMQAEKEKMVDAIAAVEREHTKQLLEIIYRGQSTTPLPRLGVNSSDLTPKFSEAE